MSNIIKLKKGLDINLVGEAEKTLVELPMAESYSVSPLDFEGVTPKLLVKVGDKVKAGSALFFSKNNRQIVFTSPVSGTVAAVNRGEKRKILNVVITPDAEQVYEEFKVPATDKASAQEIAETLLAAGLWPMVIQRPYGIIANPADKPKAIFVSGFDSAPLAPDMAFVMKDRKDALQKGFDVLGKLTAGKVHLSVEAGNEGIFSQIKGVELHTFQGPHPAGNVGVQIHHIDRIGKGETVWTVNIQDVAVIGNLFLKGKVDMTRIAPVTGSEIEKPLYVKYIYGAPLASLLGACGVKKQQEGDSVRIICGNVLTGAKSSAEGYTAFYMNQLTVIPEGDKYELLGWMMPRTGKFSVSKTYFSWLCPKKKYTLDTNLNGGERPFVVTGLFEKYVPMDIYPMYLLKAILAEDIDKMENLGIYEVTEEDLALCEFVDPSKTEIQEIVRKGINLMIKELN